MINNLQGLLFLGLIHHIVSTRNFLIVFMNLVYINKSSLSAVFELDHLTSISVVIVRTILKHVMLETMNYFPERHAMYSFIVQNKSVHTHLTEYNNTIFLLKC